MASNPFFSGRIPPDLYERIQQHITETGESKTQILINALAAYLNHPVKIQSTTPNSDNEVSIKIFAALEKRVATLEQLFKISTKSVINTDKSHENIVINRTNSNEFPDLWITASELVPQTEDKQHFTEFNRKIPQSVIKYDSNVKLLSPFAVKSENCFDNVDNICDNKKKADNLHPKYELLTSVEMRKLTGITQPQIGGHKRKVNEKYKKFGQSLEEKTLLKTTEKIKTKKPVTINNYPYELFYAGQNEKGKDLWTLIPSDTNCHQQLSAQFPLEKVFKRLPNEIHSVDPSTDNT